MTKTLEDTLNLPHLKEALAEALAEAEDVAEQYEEDSSPKDFVNSLGVTNQPMVVIDGEDHSKKMDDLYDEVLEHARNIVDLGFNLPPGQAASVFEQGSSMYKNAVDVVNSKREFQLKTLKLRLEQRKMQLEEQKFSEKQKEKEPDTIDAEMVEDRNAIIRQMLEDAKKSAKT